MYAASFHYIDMNRGSDIVIGEVNASPEKKKN